MSNNTEGVRFEWQTDDGQWKSCWAQNGFGPFDNVDLPQEVMDAFSEDAAEAYEHISPLYRKALCMYDTVLQTEYTDDTELFPWVRIGPPVFVKEFTYDHMTQTIIIKDQNPLQNKPPQLVSIAWNTRVLERKYPNVLFEKPSKGLDASNLEKFPLVCAMCLAMTNVAGFYRCKRRETNCPTILSNDHLPSCKLCFMLRRPCIFLPYADVAAVGGRYKFARPPIRNLKEAQLIDGPKLSDSRTNGPTHEEIEAELDLKVTFDADDLDG